MVKPFHNSISSIGEVWRELESLPHRKTSFLRGERNFRETFEKEREFQDRERKRVIPFAIFYEFKFAVSQDSSCVPSLSRLLLLLRKDGNATMQSKGDVSDT